MNHEHVDTTERQQAEQAPPATEGNYREVFNAASDAIYVHDPATGEILDVNQAASELSGYSREELLRMQGEVLPTGGAFSHQEAVRRVRRAIAEGPQVFEWQSRKKTGEVIWVEVALRGATLGGQKRVLAVVHNITKRKEAEEAKDELNLLLNAIRGINRLIVQEQDPEQLLTKACEILVQTRGFPLVWIGLPERESKRVRPAARAGSHTEYLDRVTITWDEAPTGQGPTGLAMRTRQPCVIQDTAADPRYETWREPALACGFASAAAVPMITAEKVLGVISLYSEKKGTFHEAEVMLLKELASDLAFAWLSIEHDRERRRAELRVSAFAYVAQRLSVAKTARQAAEIIVAVAEQLVGLDACTLDLYSPETDRLEYVLNQDTVGGQRVDCPAVYNNLPPSARIRRVIETGGQLILKDQPHLMMADATPFGNTSQPSASILIVPVRDGPEVIGVLSIHSYTAHAYDEQSLDTLQALADHCGGALQRIRAQQELSEREQQLRQAQKMEAVGQLAGGVAHDFNNLLAVIRGHADLLLMDSAQLSPNTNAGLKEIVVASERAANLTRQLLIFSRKQRMQSRPMVLNDVIAELTRMLKRIIGEDIDLQCHYSAQLPHVQADAGMIEQALVNLTVNARDAMPRGGQLLITTESVCLDASQARKLPEARAGEFVCLTVSDTGTGIVPEHLSRIFEPFFTTKEPGKGTGLGLATVHGIVKQHQGWIEVSSQPGNGATFRIFLPVIPAPAKSPEALQAEPAFSGGTETILLVEDDYAVRLVTRRVLEAQGYKVCEASSGPEALELWASHGEEIALLLSDVVMPEGMTGRELVEQLHARKPSLKVILMSGYSAETAGQKADASTHPNTLFLKKPCPSRVLLETVRRSLDGNAA
jgi:PAS domain S-box-containing protein